MVRSRLIWAIPGIIYAAIILLSTPDSPRLLATGTVYPLRITPDRMEITGDVTTRANCRHPTVCSWLGNTPEGTIMLGVDPSSPNPIDWDGGTAKAEVFLPNLYERTLLVLKVSWPDREGKGLHSPEQNRAGIIYLDGRELWRKRTTTQSTFGDYYAAEHEPILTTIVLTQSITHTLRFSVTAHTAWDLSQIELFAYPYPSMIRGIGYSPYRDCQYPGGEHLPSTEDLKEDLFRLFHTATAIRTYAATGVNGQIPALANQLGLPVFAGAWIDYPKTTREQDNAEIQALIRLACTTDVAGLIVGNEYYLRHRSSEYINYLVERIREVKQGVAQRCGKTVPVTTAEIDDLMFGWQGNPPVSITGTLPIYRPVLNELDFVMVHIYPFWSRMPIEGAAAFTVSRYKAIQELLEREYPDKWLIIGETGWPSGGLPNGAAIPNPVHQQKYLVEFLSLADREEVNFLYFDAFDELWKVEEPGGVGKHWGYSYTDRSAKYHFYGVLLPKDYLPTLSLHKAYLPLISRTGAAITPERKLVVYDEWPEEHFVPSGWMGDIDNIEFFGCDRRDPHSGEMAIRISYTPGITGWAGIYWQYPENNWGNINKGLDLRWANKVTFWAKGEKGGERIRFFVGGIGTKGDPYPDSWRPQASTGFVELSTRWQKYTIPLVVAKPEPSWGQNLSHVIGGFGWATDRCANPSGATFYLDDILYEYDPNLSLPSPGPVFAIYTDAGAPGNHYIPSGWMGDAAIPGRVSLTECWYDQPHSGQTSIRVAYTQAVTGWAGMYWVHPSGTWGDRPGGYDLTGVDRLSFWARSDTPNAAIKIVIGGIGYEVDSQGQANCSHPIEPYPDSVCPKIQQWVSLSHQWTKYTIDLHLYSRDWSKTVGGFGWVAEKPVVFYLDDIAYEFDQP